MFDFTIEALQRSTDILVNKMNSAINCVKPFDLSVINSPELKGKSIRDSLELLSILSLLMVRFPPIDFKRSIHLLHKDQPHELVWEGHF